MVKATDEPIDPNSIFDTLKKYEGGSVIIHTAVVRGKTGDTVTTSIEFTRNGDVEAELSVIANEIRTQHGLEDICLIRRIGTVGVGDVISLVATSSQRSANGFAACQGAIERLKQMQTILKNEV